ncbi:MAG: hypothetical protein LQ342_005806 [Letrouitia transgressa]|nr:MAG: hypothetical protein LQ342_005806 [Letrouitia transgressa]
MSPRGAKRRQREKSPARGEQRPELDQAADSNDSASSSDSGSFSSSSDDESTGIDDIQILNIHTKNPQISYNSQLFSCSWGSTVGTDLYLSSPLFSSQRPEEELATFTRVSIVGASGIRLIGQAAELVPRYDKPVSRVSVLGKRRRREPQPAVDSQDSHAQPLQGLNGPMEETASMDESHHRIQVDDATSSLPGPHGNQSTFLQGLSDLKNSKGDTDTVSRYPPRTYTGFGWRWQQRQLDYGETDDDLELEYLYESFTRQQRRGRVGRPRRRAMGASRLLDRQIIGDLQQSDTTPKEREELQIDEETKDPEATTSNNTEKEDDAVEMGGRVAGGIQQSDTREELQGDGETNDLEATTSNITEKADDDVEMEDA